MRGVGKVNVVPRDSFPSFPSHYVPSRPHLTAMFIRDYWENKLHIMRELRSVVSSHGLAVDHQSKVVKRTRGGSVISSGGQTFTICGDFGVVCGVYVVPDTALSWAKDTMSEVIDRHKSIGVAVPQSLYMDCGCCNRSLQSDSTTRSSASDPTTSVSALWRSIFAVKLDAMHLILRIGREMNAEHSRRKKFLINLSHAIFSQYEEDLEKLIEARHAAGLSGPPKRVERYKFIRRVVGDAESVANRMVMVLNAHRELDRQCRMQAEAAGMEVENLTVADVAYPLVTNRVMSVFQQQLINVRNGCISDDPERLPYVQVGTVNLTRTVRRLGLKRALSACDKSVLL